MNRICIGCGRKLPDKPLFTLANAPASAQDIPAEKDLASDKGISLSLFACETCGLVQFDCEPVSYYRDVIRAGGLSTTMTELRRRQYRHLIETYHLEGKKFLEVGCGRGEFLRILTEFPVRAYGMEHREDLVRSAQQSGLAVWQGFPESEDQRFFSAPYDVFLSFNFLEHQPQPAVYLRAVYNNLADEAYGLITVPALEYIADEGSYYELIRDHIAYYSADTLLGLLTRNGFEVLEEETVNRDTLAVTVKKIPDFSWDETPESFEINAGSPTEESFGKSGGLRKEKAKRADMTLAKDLAKGYETVQNQVAKYCERLAWDGKSLALWGAGHQGFTLSATTELGGFARYIIDSAPFKQGLYAPASHLPIVAPGFFYKDKVDAILIVAPGYTEEIAAEIREDFGREVAVSALRSDHIENFSKRRFL